MSEKDTDPLISVIFSEAVCLLEKEQHEAMTRALEGLKKELNRSLANLPPGAVLGEIDLRWHSVLDYDPASTFYNPDGTIGRVMVRMLANNQES